MDSVKRLSEALIDHRKKGTATVRMCIPKAAGNRLMTDASGGVLRTDWDPTDGFRIVMGVVTVPPPVWWPEDFVGLQDATGRWHYVNTRA